MTAEATKTERAWLDMIIAREQAGEALTYVCFWGHTHKGDAIDKTCLSQWYPSPFVVAGETYPTAEHWMMAGKARACGDVAAIAAILAEPDPAKVKALGRKIQNYVDDKWRAARLDVVTQGSIHKFEQNPKLRSFLFSTGDAILVEASPTDAIWGIGAAESDPRATKPSQWPGLNLLGLALMAARAQMRGL